METEDKKLCINCKHCKIEGDDGYKLSAYLCTRMEEVDINLVTGKPFFTNTLDCNDERRNFDDPYRCGKEAKYYEHRYERA